ncbi:MAG: T9SS type A sorting domain-containing protein [Vicingaceae bacterium]
MPDVIYYQFDESDSLVVNAATNPAGLNPAIIQGNQYQGSGGQFGKALVTSGGLSSINYVNTGWSTNLGTGDWTISLWIGGNVPTILSNYFFGDNSSNNFRCFTGGIAGNGMYLRGGGLTDVIIPGNLFNNPVVVTYVYDSSASNVKAYVNGSLAVTQSQSGTPNLSSTGLFKVGGYASGNCMTGKLDEFRIYSYALDSAEVQNIWNNILPLPYSENDAGVTDIVQPGIGCSGNPKVLVEIMNLGTNLIDTVEIEWSVNGVAQTPLLYTQQLDTLGGTGSRSDTVSLGNMQIQAGNSYALKAWTTSPNNVNDTINGNDTTDLNFTGIQTPSVNIGSDTIFCSNDTIVLDAGPNRDSTIWMDNSTNRILLADTAGVYSVTVFESGCPNSDTILLDVHLNPKVDINVNPDTLVCANSTYFFTASARSLGSTLFRWRVNGEDSTGYVSDSTFSPALGHKDKVMVEMITSQCSTNTYLVSSDTITIHLLPVPQRISDRIEPDTVLENSTKVYYAHATPTNQYKWRVKGGTITGDSTLDSVTIQWNGQTSDALLSLEETDTGQCAFTNNLFVIIQTVDGVAEWNASQGIVNIFPNPSNSFVTINWEDGLNEIVEINVLNMSGQEVFGKNIFIQRNTSIDISSLPTGKYFLLVKRSNSYSEVVGGFVKTSSP